MRGCHSGTCSITSAESNPPYLLPPATFSACQLHWVSDWPCSRWEVSPNFLVLTKQRSVFQMRRHMAELRVHFLAFLILSQWCVSCYKNIICNLSLILLLVESDGKQREEKSEWGGQNHDPHWGRWISLGTLNGRVKSVNETLHGRISAFWAQNPTLKFLTNNMWNVWRGEEIRPPWEASVCQVLNTHHFV